MFNLKEFVSSKEEKIFIAGVVLMFGYFIIRINIKMMQKIKVTLQNIREKIKWKFSGCFQGMKV